MTLPDKGKGRAWVLKHYGKSHFRAGKEYCKCCGRYEFDGISSLYGTEEDGTSITVCQVCGTVQEQYQRKQ